MSKGLLEDLAMVVGLAALLYGVAQVSGPAAWMVAGAALIAGAMAAARRRS